MTDPGRLDDEALSLLALHREATRLPELRRERIAAVLEGTGPPATEPAESDPSASSWQWMRYGSAGVAIVMVIVVAVLMWPEASVLPTPAKRGVGVRPDIERLDLEVTPRVLVFERAPTLELGPPTPATPATKRQSTALDEDDLRAEVESLKAIQAANQSGDHTRALSLLTVADRRFAKGRLVEARAVARMVALCGTGDEQALEHARTRFLARHGTSAFADRVRSICK